MNESNEIEFSFLHDYLVNECDSSRLVLAYF